MYLSDDVIGYVIKFVYDQTSKFHLIILHNYLKEHRNQLIHNTKLNICNNKDLYNIDFSTINLNKISIYANTLWIYDNIILDKKLSYLHIYLYGYTEIYDNKKSNTIPPQIIINAKSIKKLKLTLLSFIKNVKVSNNIVVKHLVINDYEAEYANQFTTLESLKLDVESLVDQSGEFGFESDILNKYCSMNPKLKKISIFELGDLSDYSILKYQIDEFHTNSLIDNIPRVNRLYVYINFDNTKDELDQVYEGIKNYKYLKELELYICSRYYTNSYNKKDIDMFLKLELKSFYYE